MTLTEGNNALENLRWDTVAANHADMLAHRAGADAVRARLVMLRERFPHLMSPGAV